MNVLIIEDNPTDLKLLSALMRAGEHKVVATDSVESAVKEIKARKPEVILLDLKLRGVNGLVLARLLKADPDTTHIPIIAITARPDVFSQEDALAAGCAAYIIKPVDTRQLSQQIDAAVAPKEGI